jgi:hypothetical protein
MFCGKIVSWIPHLVSITQCGQWRARGADCISRSETAYWSHKQTVCLSKQAAWVLLVVSLCFILTTMAMSTSKKGKVREECCDGGMFSVTVYLSLTPPSRWSMSWTSFRLPSSPLPTPAASLRGLRQTCDGWHLPLCDPTRRTVLSDSKLWVGFLIFGFGNLFGLFVLGITVQYCVFFILAFYGLKGISGDRRYCTVLLGVVWIVSHGELCCYVKQVITYLCWWDLRFHVHARLCLCCYVKQVIMYLCWWELRIHVHARFCWCYVKQVIMLFRAVFWVVQPCKIFVENHFTPQYQPEYRSEQNTSRRENLKSHIGNHVSLLMRITYSCSCKVLLVLLC